jgi:hypothetical protein
LIEPLRAKSRRRERKSWKRMKVTPTSRAVVPPSGVGSAPLAENVKRPVAEGFCVVKFHVPAVGEKELP